MAVSSISEMAGSKVLLHAKRLMMCWGKKMKWMELQQQLDASKAGSIPIKLKLPEAWRKGVRLLLI